MEEDQATKCTKVRPSQSDREKQIFGVLLETFMCVLCWRILLHWFYASQLDVKMLSLTRHPIEHEQSKLAWGPPSTLFSTRIGWSHPWFQHRCLFGKIAKLAYPYLQMKHESKAEKLNTHGCTKTQGSQFYLPAWVTCCLPTGLNDELENDHEEQIKCYHRKEFNIRKRGSCRGGNNSTQLPTFLFLKD